MEFDINPNELSLQGPDGMQLVQILRKLIVAIDGGDEPEPTQTSGLYYCTYGTTTSAQIAQAITDGLLPVCLYGGRYYYLVYRQVNIFTFASFDNTQLILYRIKCNGSNWSFTSAYLQTLLDFDYAPTQGSTNPVTSGGVWTAIQQGGGGSDIDPYQQYPAMDGTASPGSSDNYARGDHVHPTDTSRAAVSEITRIDAALAGKADQASIQQTIEDTVDDWLTVQAPSIGTLSYAAKQALLACFRKVAWIDDQGQTYYDTLENELFPDSTLQSITAVFTQGTAVIYDTDSLDTLRQYLVVTANYSDSTSETVTSYTLSGTLVAGTSTITVSYGGKTTTFTVTVSEPTREMLFGQFLNGYAIRKTLPSETDPLKCWRVTGSPRATTVSPFLNRGYTFTVTNSTLYSLVAVDVVSLDKIKTNVPASAVDGYMYQGGTKTINYGSTDSVTSEYCWLCLRKNNNTQFTEAELADGASAVFTFTKN